MGGLPTYVPIVTKIEKEGLYSSLTNKFPRDRNIFLLTFLCEIPKLNKSLFMKLFCFYIYSVQFCDSFFLTMYEKKIECPVWFLLLQRNNITCFSLIENFLLVENRFCYIYVSFLFASDCDDARISLIKKAFMLFWWFNKVWKNCSNAYTSIEIGLQKWNF